MKTASHSTFPNSEDPDELIAIANMMADAARDAILPYFRSPSLGLVNKDKKGGFDPVTRADRAAEVAMRAVLSDSRPQDGILGEEEGTTPGTSGLTWVLDPIDGTRAFMAGMPTWGSLIALDAGEGPVLGIVDQPYIRERFIGGLGKAELQRIDYPTRPLSVRPCSALADAVLFTTFPEVGSSEERIAFEAVRDTVRLTRYGTDCYAYALLAAGQVDLVIEAGLQAYDIQGPQAVIEAAGGIVTTWDGGQAKNGGRIIAAGDAHLHAQACQILSESLSLSGQ